MLLPTAALSLHPQCNPHNRLISAANVEQIFQTTKFWLLAISYWLTFGDPTLLRLGNSNMFDCSRLNRGVGLPLATRPCSASAISVAA